MSGFFAWAGLILNVLGVTCTGWALYTESLGFGIKTMPQRVWAKLLRLLHSTRHAAIHGVAAADVAHVTSRATGLVQTGDPVDDRFRRIELKLSDLGYELQQQVVQMHRLNERVSAQAAELDDMRQREERLLAEVETPSKDRELLGLALVALGSLCQGIALVQN